LKRAGIRIDYFKVEVGFTQMVAFAGFAFDSAAESHLRSSVMTEHEAVPLPFEFACGRRRDVIRAEQNALNLTFGNLICPRMSGNRKRLSGKGHQAIGFVFTYVFNRAFRRQHYTVNKTLNIHSAQGLFEQIAYAPGSVSRHKNEDPLTGFDHS
jgi:hypothetical protein